MNLGVALGVGLLVGAERERRNTDKDQGAAGVRTFGAAALAGALGLIVGGPVLLAVATTLVAAFMALAYWRTRGDRDPGLTTEIALVITTLLGGLAMTEPQLAAVVGVVLAILLAGRDRLHHFIRDVVTAEEVEATLLLGAATLVVLPLLPTQPIGPFDALNLRTIWKLVILVLAIGAAGHVAVRALGARFGLPVAGLASGFVSSTATIGAMGARVKKTPELMSAASAGAILSTVATVIQTALVIGATSMPTLHAMTLPLICAGVAAVAYGAVFTVMGFRHTPPDEGDPGKAVSLKAALTFGGILAAVMLASAALRAWFGDAGTIAAAGLAGFADAHAAAISVAALAASGHMPAEAAVLPILAGLTTNTVSKIVFAIGSGGRAFALRVIPGLLLVIGAAWAGAIPALMAAI